VIVRPNELMQSFSILACAIRAGELPLAIGTSAVSWVDVEDVVDVAVHAITTREAPPQLIEATGPNALTGDEVADALGNAIGRALRYRVMTDAEVLAAMIRAGLPEPVARHMVVTQRLLRECGGDAVSDAVPRMVGRLARSLPAVVRRDVDLFLGCAARAPGRTGARPWLTAPR
jgi:uncharacterized protein YbjT (DUF2867 family)